MMVPSSVVLERIGEQFNTLHCKLDWLETQTIILQNENRITDDKIDSLGTQMNDLQSENRIKDDKIDSLETQMNDLQGQVTTLKAKLYQPDLRGILNVFHRESNHSTSRSYS